jgi:cytochrome c peroxidase
MRILIVLAFAAVAVGCGEDAPPTTPFALAVPQGFPPPPIPEDNLLTVEGVLLGRRLFYDPVLSRDSTQSCASCHNTGFGMTDHGLKYSVGITGAVGDRNSMPLHNLAYHTAFFWDGRSPSLRDLTLLPIQDPREMDHTIEAVLASLNANPVYRDLFWKAFGVRNITAEEVGLAMEQFLLTIMSGSSKFDRFVRGLESLSAEEQLGLQLFNGEANPNAPTRGADCFHCHGGTLFTNHKFMNNGLNEVHDDPGLGGVTGNANDVGKFKVPSLRNIAYTAPYMHDGRFQTLMQVVEFYNSGTHTNSPNIDPSMGDIIRAGGLGLNLQERMALVAFLNTLTDTSIESDTLFQNPFN